MPSSTTPTCRASASGDGRSARRRASPPRSRIAEANAGPTPDGWLTGRAAAAAFTFPNGFFHGAAEVRVNRLGSHTIYGYHQEAWGRYRGVFFADPALPASPAG